MTGCNVSALKNQPANSFLHWIHPYHHARSVPAFLINKKETENISVSD
ncbi:hypothetical protein Bateq7PJ16_4127 [Bacillus subtilis]|nr:hypothetical protein Bateq7PJ16_4127 [Bacillus subtilis]RPK03947.1 hypothetical protein EH11_00351 [Bacillus subtilis]RPK13731.1 hypothetical protein EH5_00355 [Bacillus subtilis]RUS09618.1 hypothetical protein EFW59_00349 [Bacillus subtilis]